MLSFKVNNNRKLCVSQLCPNGQITVYTTGNESEKLYIISAGDFVMLLNLYRHIKNNDIQNDFINLHGANKEE